MRGLIETALGDPKYCSVSCPERERGDVPLFLRGLIIGFAIAAPVGAIGVLCIRRTLAYGWTVGFATGLGAATADAVYGAVAAFGLTAVAAFLNAQTLWLRFMGGVALLVIGWRTFAAVPATCAEDETAPRWWSAYASALGLTLTNPSTILSFAAVFAGFGLADAAATGGWASTQPGWLVLGVFLGSAAWWLMLSGIVGLFRARVNTRALRVVNRVSGAVIAGFGVAAIASGVVLLGK